MFCVVGMRATHWALKTQVKHKAQSESLELASDLFPNPILYFEGRTVHISYSRIYQPIVLLKLKAADRFCSWMFQKLLPSIHKTGHYKLEAMKDKFRVRIEEKDKVFCGWKTANVSMKTCQCLTCCRYNDLRDTRTSFELHKKPITHFQQYILYNIIFDNILYMSYFVPYNI